MQVSYDTELYINYYYWLINNNQMPKYYKSYLGHVLNHKNMVYIAWIYIADTLFNLGFIDENDLCQIENIIISHDDSKFKRDEFIPYAKRFNGPRNNDSKVLFNFKNAVKLHKERNLHHYEFLKSYKGKDWKRYAIELICDYIAMGWEYDNYIYEYFQKVKDELKVNLPEEYYNYIECIINIIPERFPLAEKPLTINNVEYIYYIYNYYNDPFEDYSLGEQNSL